jgi:hypothetical protein
VKGDGIRLERDAVPPLDDDRAGVLDDLQGIHCGIDLIRDGIRLLGLDRHTADQTQTILAALTGSDDNTDVLAAIALLIQRLTDPATNPALRPLPYEAAKRIQQCGEEHAYCTAEFAPRQVVADACALISPS